MNFPCGNDEDITGLESDVFVFQFENSATANDDVELVLRVRRLVIAGKGNLARDSAREIFMTLLSGAILAR
jgi:hypothetical protein